MTKSFKHVCPAAPGATRNSPRNYTHCVVADFNRNEALAYDVESAKINAKRDWDYYSGIVAKPYPETGPEWKVFSDKNTNKVAREFVAKHKNFAECETFYIARAVESFVSTPDGCTQVLQWSMSERAAHAAVGTWAKRLYRSYRNVRVAPAHRV